MTGVIDREFQKTLVKDCINELVAIQNPRPEDLKLFEDVIKKYENKIYEKYAHRIPVNTIDDKRIKEDFHTGPRPGFGVGFGQQQPGQINQINQFGFSPQKNQGPGFQGPSLQGGFNYPGAFPQEARNYGDPQANSKYYYPQDHLLNPPQTLNKPINPQYQMPNVGIPDPFSGPTLAGQNPFIDPRLQPGVNPFNPPLDQFGGFHRPQDIPFPNFGQPGPLQNPHVPNMPNLPGGPQGLFNDEQLRLRRNVELIGGIERTLPNMERSLREYEFRALEHSIRSPPKNQNPGLVGTDPYNQYNPNQYNPNQYNPNQYNQYNQNPYNQFGQSLQNPGYLGGTYPTQYDPATFRGASPIRGTTGGQSTTNRSLYTSPDRGRLSTDFEQRQNNFMRNQYGYSEDKLRKEHKVSLNSSKELRQQKLEALGVKFNLPQKTDEDE